MFSIVGQNFDLADVLNRLFMKKKDFLSPPPPFPDLLCLRSSRSKYECLNN